MSQSRRVPPPAIPPPRVPAAAQPRGSGYRITVGSYLHQGPGTQALPPALAGHSFVAIQDPAGRRQAFGFSPAQYAIRAAICRGSLRQCATFAGDVLRAGAIDAFPGGGVRQPRQIYGQLAQPGVTPWKR